MSDEKVTGGRCAGLKEGPEEEKFREKPGHFSSKGGEGSRSSEEKRREE